MSLTYTPMLHGFGNVIIVDPDETLDNGYISDGDIATLTSANYVSLSTNAKLTWEKVSKSYELDDYSQKQILIGFIFISFLCRRQTNDSANRKVSKY